MSMATPMRPPSACLCDTLGVAGNSLVFGNAEHFEFVSELVEECREAL
jgi:hypothetical protein